MLALAGVSSFTLSAAALPAAEAPPAVLSSHDAGMAACLRPQGYAPLSLGRVAGPHLEIVATINGVSGLFLVDTGAQISVIHRGSLQKFRLKAVKTGVRVYGAVGGPGERIDAALASRIKIGPCEASPFLLGVSDLGPLNQGRRRPIERRFDGIIGADVLQNFAFVIDCNGLQLYGRSADAPSGDAKGLGDFLRSRGYSEVPMQRHSISDFEVMANVNNRRALWLVDTGAAITLLDSHLSRQAGVRLKRTNLSVGGAGGGRQRIAVGIVDNLRLSTLRVRSAMIAVSDISANNAALQESGKPPIDGYLGADFLREKGAVIDCGKMRLYLKN
jgi:predicted aspartyl protease